MSRVTHNCQGIARRDFIQLGLGGMLGLGSPRRISILRHLWEADIAVNLGKRNETSTRSLISGGQKAQTFLPKFNELAKNVGL